jgi:hypothetical protein
MPGSGERLTPLDILAHLVGFDTESSKPNLDLIDWVAAYLDGWGVPHLRIPNAARSRDRPGPPTRSPCASPTAGPTAAARST